MSDLLIALDFGGTKLSAGVAARGETAWRGLKRAPSKPGATAEDDLTLMTSLADELIKGDRPAAVGVSFGGPVDAPHGVVRLSDHVPGWEDYPLQERLEQRYNVPASVDNDANVAALGEYVYGAGRGCHSLLYVTVSTGVGGGWILDGKVWRGFDGMAGEIGHTVIDPNGPMCFCGKRGCVERLASGPYLAEYARELLDAEPAQGRLLRGQVEDLEHLSAQQVSAAAAAGDDLAWQALERAAWALGLGLGNAVNFVNPQRIVLGGGVTKSGERYWDKVRSVARVTARDQATLDLVPAALGDDAPLWGAVALAEAVLEGSA
ncbi:ROK family protein [soil metagenome]